MNLKLKLLKFFSQFNAEVKKFLIAEGSILVLSAIFYIFHLTNVLMILLILELMTVILFCILDFRNRFMLLFFVAMFFIFLCGQLIFDFFQFGDVLIGFSNSAKLFTVFSMLYSLTLIAISFVLFHNEKLKANKKIFINKHNKLEFIFIGIFIFSAIFIFIKYWELYLFINEYGYLSVFTSFNTKLPSIVHQFANFYRISFFCFLALFPTKKRLLWCSGVFLLVSSFTVLNGARGTLMINVVITIIYFFIRDYFNVDDTPIITKKVLIIGAICLPVLMILMSVLNILRYGATPINFNIFDSLYDFVYNMGVSSKVIAYSVEYKTSFNPNFIYSLSPITNLLRAPSYAPNTIEMATLTNNFQYTVSYFALGTRYLSGEGIGGCYIAEMYVDFGIYGVTIISFIYGCFLSKIPYLFKEKFIFGAMALLSICAIMWAPRGAAFEFISAPFESKNIIIFVIIYMLYIYHKDIIKIIKEFLPWFKKN